MFDANPVFSSDGKRIVFSRATLRRPYIMGGWTWDHWDIWVINSDGSGLKRTTSQQYRLKLSPLFMQKINQIVFDAEKDDLFALFATAELPGSVPNEFGGRPKVGQKGGEWAMHANLSIDGKHMVFSSDRVVPFERDLRIMNSDETNSQPLGVTSVSDYNQNPVFMPDGDSILFLAGTESGAGSRRVFSLWQVTLKDKKAREVADSELFTYPTRWTHK